MKIDRAHVEVVPGRDARDGILTTRLKCCLTALCLLMVGLLPLGAVAQITESLLPYPPSFLGPPASPQEPRSPYAPIGVHIGDFFWYPHAGLQESYNSNIFATPTRPTFDLITGFQPGFDLLSLFRRNSLNLHGNSLLQLYADHPAQNTQDGSVSIDGTYGVTAGSSLYGTAEMSHGHISYGSPNSPGNIAQPVTYWSYSATAGYAQFGRRFSYNVDLGVDAAQYNAAPLVGGGTLPQSSQDASASSAAVTGSYEIIPDYRGYVRVGASLFDYWHTVPGGTRANFSTYRANLGLQIRPRHLISGEAYAGYLVLVPAQSGQSSTSSPDFGGRMTWSITPLTTLNFTSLFTFSTGTPGSTTFLTASAGNSYLSRIFTGSADHELLRNLLLNLNASYENDIFQGVSRTDNVFTVGVGVRYLVNRNLFFGALFNYQQRDSTASCCSYNQNVVTLRVGTQF